MSTVRADRLARVRRAVDREHAEPIRVEPQIVGDFGATLDPDRPAFDAEAVPVTARGADRNLSGGNTIDWTARIAGQGLTLAVDPVRWPAASSVRIGDIVSLTDRDTRFEVARVDPNGRARLMWSLTQR